MTIPSTGRDPLAWNMTMASEDLESPNPGFLAVGNLQAIIEGRCFEYLFSIRPGGDLGTVATP